MENINRATSLAKWLIETKGVKKKQAYIIASKKYNLEHYSLVRKAYNRIKPKQISLFP
jgi:hypothetical protein